MVKSDIGDPTGVPADFEATVKRLSLDLRDANLHLVHARLPQTTLQEMSESVDLIRSTVWVVLNSVIDEFGVGQPATTLLTSHRIQRTRALLEALIEEMDGGRIHGKTPSLENLCNLLGVVYKKSQYLLGKRQSSAET